ncbi:hypothetical protein J2TS6_19000 [Paenibacillus albilobatus]|uniref:Uncharacterized protein n=1 Tax=Paenibacillus albilobatus TaxID=2716884 RepID=A0A920CB74_9BACL|nr:hypothetical protein [Paenibacillus albilobatus]GIO30759.1 hypothetical protein J2TS6_19000 [Paenibacillus albilobatus]
MTSRVIIRAGITAIIIVMVCLLIYAIFFKTREPNYFGELLEKRQSEKVERYEKALRLLKEKNYSEAEKTAILDLPFQSSGGIRTETDTKEKDVFYFANFMVTENDNPIDKYSSLMLVEPIEGVVTQIELDKLKAEWKQKSDEANRYVEKQVNEALQGLTEDEKSFVRQYMFESINGKTPDPGVVASHSTRNLTATEATEKARAWMEDPRIIEAMEKYKNVSYKYDAESNK